MADPAAVVNASPLIFLSKAGRLDLLQLAALRVIIPEPVNEEIARRGPEDSTAKALSETPWLVLLAKQRGIVPAARPLIARLKRHGMFLSEHVIEKALALVDE